MVPNRNINIPELIEKIKEKLVEWKETHPFCQILFTIPYIPQFGRYNTSRLCRKLTTRQVEFVYPHYYSQNFTRQMKTLIDQFFYHWDQELTPRPLALSRLSTSSFTNNNYQQAFRGSTKDGLHFSEKTVQQFWRLVWIHREFLNKNPGKAYLKRRPENRNHVPETRNPQEINQNNINRRNTKQIFRRGQRHNTGRQPFSDKQLRFQNRPYVRNVDITQAGPSGIRNERNIERDDLRNKIQNRQNQLNYGNNKHPNQGMKWKKVSINVTTTVKRITKEN